MAESKSKRGRPSAYSPHLVGELLAYARAAHRAQAEVETHAGRDGLKYVAAPSAPASFSAFASRIGVSRSSLVRWRESHPEWAYACEVAATCFEAIAVRNAALGSWSASVAALALQSNAGWRERSNVELSGPAVVLHFDKAFEGV